MFRIDATRFCVAPRDGLNWLGTMASGNERDKPGRMSERRRRRNGRLADALRLQLEACREDEGLAAIVVADELGFCVAHSGGDGGHDELAARLPMLADPAQRGYLDDDAGRLLAVTTFSIPGATLHVGAVQNPDAAANASTAEVLARVASGFTRLLAQ